jgi:SAM-dependent methyltransferase
VCVQQAGSAPGCGFCGAPRARLLLAFTGFSLVQCADCHVASVTPLPTVDAAGERYDSTYLGYLLGNTAATELIVARTLRLLQVHVQGGAVLDVGFGAGHFLGALMAAGYDAHGVEISAAAVEHARATQPAAHVTRGDLAAVDPGRSFAAVTMWDSLQYSPTPAAYLRKAHALLDPGGVLVVQVPNRGEHSLRYARRLHRLHPELARTYLHLPAALTLYSEGSLVAALRSAGFDTVELADDPGLRRFRWSGGHGPKDVVRNVIENVGIGLEKRSGERHPLTAVAIK